MRRYEPDDPEVLQFLAEEAEKERQFFAEMAEKERLENAGGASNAAASPAEVQPVPRPENGTCASPSWRMSRNRLSRLW